MNELLACFHSATFQTSNFILLFGAVWSFLAAVPQTSTSTNWPRQHSEDVVGVFQLDYNLSNRFNRRSHI